MQGRSMGSVTSLVTVPVVNAAVPGSLIIT